MVQDVVRLMQQSIQSALASITGSTVRDFVQPVLAAIKSVRDARSERQAVDIPFVKPVERLLGSQTVEMELGDGRTVQVVEDDYAIDMPVERTMQTLLKHDPEFCADVLSFNSRLQARRKSVLEDVVGAGPGKSAVIADLLDAQGLAMHPCLGQDLKDGGAVWCCFQFYGDGVTIANPIGVFRNNSRLDLFFWALVNLTPDKRLSLRYLQLATMCANKDLKHYGSALVISGGTPDGQPSTSFGASMMRLNETPVYLEVPNPMKHLQATQPYVSVPFQGWCPLLAGALPSIARVESAHTSWLPIRLLYGLLACR